MGKPEMENKEFNKIFKDSGLIGKNLSVTDLDIIFAKYKIKGEKRMKPNEFEVAFQAIAKQLGMNHQELIPLCSAGPKFVGTKAEKVALHDNKELYTGVYAKGGPSTVDKGKNCVSDLSELANRGEANVRGVNKNIKQQ